MALSLFRFIAAVERTQVTTFIFISFGNSMSTLVNSKAVVVDEDNNKKNNTAPETFKELNCFRIRYVCFFMLIDWIKTM